MSKYFDDLLARSIDLHGQHPESILVVFTCHNTVMWMREVYMSAGPLKKTIRNVWTKVLTDKDFLKEVTECDPHLLGLITYTLSRIKEFHTSEHMHIRQWAKASQELEQHPQCLAKLVQYLDQGPLNVKTWVTAGVHSMTLDCIQHRCIFKPYDDTV